MTRKIIGIARMIRNLKNNRSFDSMQITSEMLKAGGEQWHEHICLLE